MYDNYSDCKNKCEYEYGKNKECLSCSYYNDCMIENEIAEFELKQERLLDECLDRLENGEHF